MFIGLPAFGSLYRAIGYVYVVDSLLLINLNPAKMKAAFISVVAALAGRQVAGHATFQQLWVNGVDQICIRNPVEKI